MNAPADPDPIAHALSRLASGRDLSEPEAHLAVGQIMSGGTTDARLAAFLTALRFKGETADELAGAVRAVRERMSAWDGSDRPPGPLVDTCGTGGDGANTVNISTAAALVVASTGVPVAKHGNRSASGNSGSAEVLAELGIDCNAPPERARRSLSDLGLTFLFAPLYHPALRHAGPVRKQLPFRTLFNLVGPLANPARPDFQVVGVSGERAALLIAETLSQLGTRRSAVVRGGDGLDEVTLGAPTHVLWVEADAITQQTWMPADFGLPYVSAAELRVSGPAESAASIRSVLAGEAGPARSAILANAAAALLVTGRVETLREGAESAAEAIDSGRAADLLDRWRRLLSAGPADVSGPTPGSSA